MKKILLLSTLALSSVLMADDIIGGLVGGAIGGVIGHQIGRGNGNTAATIGGAVIGTMIGSSSSVRDYNDRRYSSPYYSNNGYSQRYVTYDQAQPVYYVQPQQTIYVQQQPQIVYVRRHHHDDDDYERGYGYRSMRIYE